MSNDPFTLIRLRLLAVLDNRPDTIVPSVAKGVVSISAWILPDMSENGIDVVMAGLQGLSGEAEGYGRIDIADELDDIEESLRAELPDCTVEGDVACDD